MARYTDYDALIKKWHDLGFDEISRIHKVNALNHFIQNLPAADVEEVRHAYFENVVNLGDEYCFGYCSECYTEHRAYNPTALRFEHRFCRWCGARMDGKKEENDGTR